MTGKPTKLLNRNFVLLWQGQFVSKLGTQAFAIAMMFWIKHQTGSATLMGLIMMVSQLPAVILGPVAGIFADRRSRKTIIVWCDVIRGTIVLSLAAFMFAAPDLLDATIVWLFVASVAVAIVSAFFQPAIGAAIPDLVPPEKLSGANSMSQASIQLSTFFGQGAGGVLYRILGAPMLFLIDGISYLVSAISELFISIPKVEREELPDKTSGWQQFKADLVEGLRFVWTSRGLRALIFAAAFLNFFIMPIIVLMPFYVEDFLGATTDWYGFLIAGWGLGALVGYLFAGTLKLPGRVRALVIIVALIIQSTLLGVVGLVGDTYVALAIFVLAGLFNGYININISTVIQLTTPTEIRGRVFGVLATVSGGLAPLSMGLAGVAADLVDQNVPAIYLFCGLTTAALTVLLALGKDFRDFLAYEPPQTTA